MVGVTGRPLATNQGFKSIIPNREVDPSYLFHLLGVLTHELYRRASGTTFQEISGSEFGAIRIPCPQGRQQARIAEVLDTLDDAIQGSKDVVEKREGLQSGLLLSLVSPPAPGASWERTTLGQVADWTSGGTPWKSNKAYWGGDLPWVSPKDMKVFLLRDTQDHLTTTGAQNGTKVIPRHSVLVVVRGMILAHTFPVCLTQREMAINQDVKAVVARPGVSGEFLGYWFRANAERLLRLVSEATHGTKKIDLDDLKKFQILLPPIEEQQRITSILVSGDEALAAESAQLNTLRAIKSGLSTDLLTGHVRTQ
jgi:type I restriction enzyme S subunit